MWETRQEWGRERKEQGTWPFFVNCITFVWDPERIGVRPENFPLRSFDLFAINVSPISSVRRVQSVRRVFLPLFCDAFGTVDCLTVDWINTHQVHCFTRIVTGNHVQCHLELSRELFCIRLLYQPAFSFSFVHLKFIWKSISKQVEIHHSVWIYCIHIESQELREGEKRLSVADFDNYETV